MGKPIIYSVTWHINKREKGRETEAMLSSNPQPNTNSPKVKATQEKVKETHELLGIDFSDFKKCKACQNSKNENKIPTSFV